MEPGALSFLFLAPLAPLLLSAAAAAQTLPANKASVPRSSGIPIPKPASDRIYSSPGVSLVFATHVPLDTARLFIVEQRGRILWMDLGTLTVSGTPFLDIQGIVNDLSNEQGLLGLAFHPDYASNGRFYVNYTRNGDGSTVVAEYAVSGDPNVADAGSARTLLVIAQPQTNHNGGWMGFGPLDGYLYIATGDGGNFCDTGTGHTAGTGNAQDITANLLGKILRIDPLAAVPYGIPASNPFVGISGDDEIWAYGLRNPWRASFDSATGDLYIGDVGQDLREEISYQPAASTGGANYGWRCREGTACSTSGASGCPATTGCNCPGADPTLTPPVHAYSHQNPPAPAGFVCAVTGGYVYRGATFPQLLGHYLFADFCGDAIWSFRVEGGVRVDYTDRTDALSPSLDGFNVTNIQSFGEDASGELYIVSSSSIFKLVPRP
jgi:glucose/arabinose dehydrogenase